MSTTTEENDDDEITIEPSRAFTEALVEQVNKEDVQSMVELQKDMLSRYEKTNEMLINFNMLSSARCEATAQEFRQHTIVLGQMKADLDIVFRRIRSLKQRLGALYPEAFAACSDVYNILENSEEEGEEKEEEAEKVKSPVKISVTDTTTSEQRIHETNHGVEDSDVKIVQNDQAVLSDEFTYSCAVKQGDHVHNDCNAKSSEVSSSSESVSSPNIINDVKNHNTEASSIGPNNIAEKEQTI